MTVDSAETAAVGHQADATGAGRSLRDRPSYIQRAGSGFVLAVRRFRPLIGGRVDHGACRPPPPTGRGNLLLRPWD